MAVFLGQCCKSESGVHLRGSDTLDKIWTFERRAYQLSIPINYEMNRRILHQTSSDRKRKKEKRKQKNRAELFFS